MMRNEDIGGEGKEIHKCGGQGAFEAGEGGFDKVRKGMNEVIEIDILQGTALEPRHVEERQREGRGRNGVPRRANLAALEDRQRHDSEQRQNSVSMGHAMIIFLFITKSLKKKMTLKKL